MPPSRLIAKVRSERYTSALVGRERTEALKKYKLCLEGRAGLTTSKIADVSYWAHLLLMEAHGPHRNPQSIMVEADIVS